MGNTSTRPSACSCRTDRADSTDTPAPCVTIRFTASGSSSRATMRRFLVS